MKKKRSLSVTAEEKLYIFVRKRVWRKGKFKLEFFYDK